MSQVVFGQGKVMAQIVAKLVKAGLKFKQTVEEAGPPIM